MFSFRLIISSIKQPLNLDACFPLFRGCMKIDFANFETARIFLRQCIQQVRCKTVLFFYSSD
jgi:hypothetical protein